jgi:hypothetical protein
LVGDSYVGETARTLLVLLIEDHDKACSNICANINTCDQYKKDTQNFVKKNKQACPDPEEARLTFFKNTWVA